MDAQFTVWALLRSLRLLALGSANDGKWGGPVPLRELGKPRHVLYSRPAGA